MPADLIERLSALPAIRPELVEPARSRLAEHVLPTDAEIADRLVARLVCDRLR